MGGFVCKMFAMAMLLGCAPAVAPGFYEGFEYAAGSLTASAPAVWEPWNLGPGTLISVVNTASDSGSSLAATSLPAPAGNRLALQSNNSGLIAAVIPAHSGEGASIYCSFLVNYSILPSASATHFFGFSNALNQLQFGQLHARDNGGEVQFGVRVRNADPAGTAWASGTFPLGETVHLVMIYTFGAGTDPDSVVLILNPLEETEPAADASSTGHPIEKATVGFDRIILREIFSTANTGHMEVDEIRVGSDWEEAMGLNPSAVDEWQLLDR